MLANSPQGNLFSNKLREIRVNEGISISELAREASLSERTIRDTERGVRCPRPYNQSKIARALNGLIRRRTNREDADPKQYEKDEIFS